MIWLDCALVAPSTSAAFTSRKLLAMDEVTEGLASIDPFFFDVKG